MTQTFAQHLLAQCSAHSSQRPVAEPSTPKRTATTYASAVLMMAMGTTAANAASDGVIAGGAGASTGSVNLSLVIPERIDVNGISDLDLQNDRHGNLTGETSACVSGLGSGQYHLTAAGSGANGAFVATDGQSKLPYSVEYSARDGRSQPLTMGEALGQLAGSGTYQCDGQSSNARLSIRMNPPGNGNGNGTSVYGALTLVLAPE